MLIGERERPYLRPPPKFSEEGLPWGAFCKCSKCGYVGRSTNLFDYRTHDGALVCEACIGLSTKATDKRIDREIGRGEFECDPLGPGCDGGYDESLG